MRYKTVSYMGIRKGGIICINLDHADISKKYYLTRKKVHGCPNRAIIKSLEIHNTITLLRQLYFILYFSLVKVEQI